ncbi:MAG: type III pantothenate kinase [Chloroflexi bacterium]|nr:type III pantothenate kinase [Chloroflexota bacterium]
MLLAIDIGNTNIVIGLFDGRDLVVTWRMETDTRETADEYGALLLTLFGHRRIAVEQVQRAVIASVVPPLRTTFTRVCRQYFGVEPLVAESSAIPGVRVRIDNPSEVGVDRVVNALATSRLYGSPAIVIDFGTATTFDVVSAEGDYLGGAIAPGVELGVRALAQFAAQLPSVELVRPPHAIGKNTVQAMQSGAIFGYVGLVEGLVRRMAAELGRQPRVIATGGLAEVVARETTAIELVDPDLTLRGLQILDELTQPAELPLPS